MKRPTSLAVMPSSPEPLPSFKKKYLNDREVEALYGISRRYLRWMRERDKGPPFRRFGHKIVMYEVSALEHWVDSLPKGGDNLLKK